MGRKRNALSPATQTRSELKEYKVGEKPLDMVIHGGIPATDKDGQQCYLYVGIVDLLQEFDVAHKWQYGWKAVKHGISQLPFVSVQPPKKYKERFERYLLGEVESSGCFSKVANQDVDEKASRPSRLKWQRALGQIVSLNKEPNGNVA